MVTVEFALGILSVAVFIGLVWSVIAAGHTHIRVCQAVREGARVAAIARESPASVATHSFGRQLDVDVSREGKWVSVHASASSPGIAGWVGIRAQCTVTTLNESSLVVSTYE